MKKRHKKQSNSGRGVLMVVVGILLSTACLRVLFADVEQIPSNPADVPVIGAGVLAAIKSASGFETPEWILVIVAMVVEFCGRVFKTKKPFSLLYFAKDFLVLLGGFFGSAGVALDKVAQRTKDSETRSKS